MSTLNQPKGERAKLPKPRALYYDYPPASKGDCMLVSNERDSITPNPVAVIPCRSRQSARQMAKVGAFWQMTEEERIDFLEGVLVRNSGKTYDQQAAAVLSAIQQGARP